VVDDLLRAWTTPIALSPTVSCETDRTSPAARSPDLPRATRIAPASVHSIAERMRRPHSRSAARSHLPPGRWSPLRRSASNAKLCRWEGSEATARLRPVDESTAEGPSGMLNA